MNIVNLNSSSFPRGEEFYIRNSLYPRMTIYFEEKDLDLVICPHYGEAVTLENFVNDENYLFYKVPGEENNPDYYGVNLDPP